MGTFNRYFAGVLALAALTFSGPASAELGRAAPWQLGLQEAASPIMEQIHSFHNFVTAIIVVITLFVLVLLGWVMFRYNEKRNPVASRTSHHTMLEVVWTIVPILILVAIAIPSFRLLFAQYDYPKADVTINATGHQWYWSYEYPDEEIQFDSLMLADNQLKEGQPRLLSVDNEVVVPVGKNVLVQVKSTDVIHDWAMPSFGIKVDAVPGRLQTTWFRAEKEGTFYGQCSELCGRNHAFMPIAVRVVSEEEYAKWVAETKEAALDDGKSVAGAEPAGEPDADDGDKLAAIEN
ncbi:Cytochrome c oxidase subunit 2 precursor [Methyloligella halotolerans]|uniref:Cytochrome c oxidase subunit 2 n=1 Tax=Methyloligella halotolerans TaxID=1177755 RepID=A0A1E2RYP4_9HYPH|nr:cytochrome c oxidase subunit II [Methyloligella halotolerans]ODA67228.1 Cytochrome c oxidase subunit 2 precursor [Methyloligella halotolerans]